MNVLSALDGIRKDNEHWTLELSIDTFGVKYGCQLFHLSSSAWPKYRSHVRALTFDGAFWDHVAMTNIAG